MPMEGATVGGVGGTGGVGGAGGIGVFSDICNYLAQT
jgi:hypothetical protein